MRKDGTLWAESQGTTAAGYDREDTEREVSRGRGVYVYWLERLMTVSESFDRSKPSSVIQWWHDRRDMGQWWGFWLIVAGIILTVIFGLIQSITGILQVIKPSIVMFLTRFAKHTNI